MRYILAVLFAVAAYSALAESALDDPVRLMRPTHDAQRFGLPSDSLAVRAKPSCGALDDAALQGGLDRSQIHQFIQCGISETDTAPTFNVDAWSVIVRNAEALNNYTATLPSDPAPWILPFDSGLGS